MAVPTIIKQLRNELNLTHQDILMLASATCLIRNAREKAYFIAHSSGLSWARETYELWKYLDKATKYIETIQNMAIRLEKKLLKIRGEKKLAKEEKWAIGLCKNIKSALYAQYGIAYDMYENSPDHPHASEEKKKKYYYYEKKICMAALQVENHLETIESYILALKQLEIRLEKQEIEFTKKA